MSAGRIYVIGTEFLPWAKATGMAEFGGLLTALSPHCPVTCIMPHYSGMTADASEYPENFSLTPVPLNLPGVQFSGNRIGSDLPEAWEIWNTFAEKSLEILRQEAEPFDLLALDWPTGALVSQLKQGGTRCRRITFTVDLVPPPERPGTHALWRAAVAAADTIHLPSESWINQLRQMPGTEILFNGSARWRCLRYGFDATKYLESRTRLQFSSSVPNSSQRREQKRAVQKANRLNEDPDAMLVIAINRWSADDQKNNRLIGCYAEELLEIRPGMIQLLVGNTSKQYMDPKLRGRFELLEARFPGRLAVGGLDWPTQLPAADLQLMPSRYEPCGLNHAQGMMMGVLPLCSRAGCMGEPPMKDAENAFLFDWDDAAPEASANAYQMAMRRAVDCFFARRGEWDEMVCRTIRSATEYEWKSMVPQYLAMISPPT